MTASYRRAGNGASEAGSTGAGESQGTARRRLAEEPHFEPGGKRYCRAYRPGENGGHDATVLTHCLAASSSMVAKYRRNSTIARSSPPSTYASRTASAISFSTMIMVVSAE
jgi:hypothetical protein